MKYTHTGTKAIILTSTVLFTLVTAAQTALADEARFNHAWDGDLPGIPAMERFTTYGHEVVDRRISKKMYTSPPNAASVCVDLAKNHWGAVLMRDATRIDLTGATLSVNVCALSRLRFTRGAVAMKLVDADGSGYRTPDIKLFKPSTDFRTFFQHVSELTCADEEGDVPGLDLKNIVQYGLVFLDRHDLDEQATFFVDDFMAIQD